MAVAQHGMCELTARHGRGMGTEGYVLIGLKRLLLIHPISKSYNKITKQIFRFNNTRRMLNYL